MLISCPGSRAAFLDPMLNSVLSTPAQGTRDHLMAVLPRTKVCVPVCVCVGDVSGYVCGCCVGVGMCACKCVCVCVGGGGVWVCGCVWGGGGGGGCRCGRGCGWVCVCVGVDLQGFDFSLFSSLFLSVSPASGPAWPILQACLFLLL